MITKLDINAFVLQAATTPVLDVRSPAEFAHAHIPGAFSLPLFTDAERARIGTAYKQESREKAIRIGLDSFGRNMVKMVDEVESVLAGIKVSTREVCVHCWRGGMRSAAVAWLLDLYGFKVYLLTGGYKAYRGWALSQFTKSYPLLIVGGYTGSGKTFILHELAQRGENIIDLEKLALHKGSAFGNLDFSVQPGQEQFENLLAAGLFKVMEKQPSRIWVEGESQRIGLVNIPMDFFTTMRNSRLFFLDIPFEIRLQQIVSDYGKYGRDAIINGIMRIKKRLGGLETKNAINALLEDNVEDCFSPLLKYYDRLYLKSTHTGDSRPVTYIKSPTTEAKINTDKLISECRK